MTAKPSSFPNVSLKFRTSPLSLTWTSSGKISQQKKLVNFWRSLPMEKYKKFSTHSQGRDFMKNTWLSLKEKPKTATFPSWDKNKTKSFRNSANANSKKFTETCTERFFEIKTTKPKKWQALLSKMTSVKSPHFKIWKKLMSSATIVLPPKLKSKLNKNLKKNTPNKSSLSTITPN